MPCVKSDSAAASAMKLSLERRVRLLEIAAFIGGVAVVVGLVFETDWMNWPIAGEWVVVLGVSIETFVNGGIVLATRALAAIHDAELEAMRLKTAEAEKALESERLARLTLEEKLAPRRLSGAAFHRIALRLKLREPSAPVPIFVCRYDSEVMRFADDLGDVLSGAGWRVGKGGLKTYDRITLGVWIETAENATPGDIERADELEEAFQAEQIAVQRWYKVRTPSLRSPEVTDAALGRPFQILVGEKP